VIPCSDVSWLLLRYKVSILLRIAAGILSMVFICFYTSRILYSSMHCGYFFRASLSWLKISVEYTMKDSKFTMQVLFFIDICLHWLHYWALFYSSEWLHSEATFSHLSRKRKIRDMWGRIKLNGCLVLTVFNNVIYSLFEFIEIAVHVSVYIYLSQKWKNCDSATN
jgi:hypothetical protein